MSDGPSKRSARGNAPEDGETTILYDGHCDFCTSHARRLAGRGERQIRLRSFHDEGVLDDFPGLTREECMKEIKLVDAGGRVYGGAEAVVRALYRTRPLLGRLLAGYYIPGIRAITERLYAWVASNRYRIGGRAAEACETGECRRHGPGGTNGT